MMQSARLQTCHGGLPLAGAHTALGTAGTWSLQRVTSKSAYTCKIVFMVIEQRSAANHKELMQPASWRPSGNVAAAPDVP